MEKRAAYIQWMYVSEGCMCLQPHSIRSLSIAQEYSHLRNPITWTWKFSPYLRGKMPLHLKSHSVGAPKACAQGVSFFRNIRASWGDLTWMPFQALGSHGLSVRTTHESWVFELGLWVRGRWERKDRFSAENHTCTYKQTLESHRTSNFPVLWLGPRKLMRPRTRSNILPQVDFYLKEREAYVFKWNYMNLKGKMSYLYR